MHNVIRRLGTEYNLNGLFSSLSQAFSCNFIICGIQINNWSDLLCYVNKSLSLVSLQSHRGKKKKSIYHLDLLIQNTTSTLDSNLSPFLGACCLPRRCNTQVSFDKQCSFMNCFSLSTVVKYDKQTTGTGVGYEIVIDIPSSNRASISSEIEKPLSWNSYLILFESWCSMYYWTGPTSHHQYRQHSRKWI